MVVHKTWVLISFFFCKVFLFVCHVKNSSVSLYVLILMHVRDSRHLESVTLEPVVKAEDENASESLADGLQSRVHSEDFRGHGALPTEQLMGIVLQLE